MSHTSLTHSTLGGGGGGGGAHLPKAMMNPMAES